MRSFFPPVCPRGAFRLPLSTRVQHCSSQMINQLGPDLLTIWVLINCKRLHALFCTYSLRGFDKSHKECCIFRRGRRYDVHSIGAGGDLGRQVNHWLLYNANSKAHKASAFIFSAVRIHTELRDIIKWLSFSCIFLTSVSFWNIINKSDPQKILFYKYLLNFIFFGVSFFFSWN